MKTLSVGTKNEHKFREIEAILAGIPVMLQALPADTTEVDESGTTLVANAELKATGYALQTQSFCLADDTGLEVDALSGAPGVYSARYAGPDATYADNRAHLLEELRGVPPGRRQARFRCVVALANPAGEILAKAEGVLEGVILEKARGEGGFGYDPIFAVNGKTLAEISETEKNALSHRAAALVSLRHQILELL